MSEYQNLTPIPVNFPNANVEITRTPEEIEFVRRELGRSLIDLEPSAVIELYELYFDVGYEPFRFHGGTNNLEKDIVWNGNRYYATAIEVEGFEANMVGRLPRPKVTVANSDQIISNILRDFSDFRNGKFVRIKLFLKHLDDVNFEDNDNPFGTADPEAYISKERYVISQKLLENKNLIQFELITPFDLESLQTATRAIYGRYCGWQYRGMGCNYQGDLVCQENDKDFNTAPLEHIKNSGGFFVNGASFLEAISKFKWKENFAYKKGQIVFRENLDLNGIKDPPRTWYLCIEDHISAPYNGPDKSVKLWQKDACSKTISACKKRFGVESYKGNGYVAYNDSAVVNSILPFGGFPGTDKFKFA
jgi:lambda family phage minor tail protein L